MHSSRNALLRAHVAATASPFKPSIFVRHGIARCLIRSSHSSSTEPAQISSSSTTTTTTSSTTTTSKGDYGKHTIQARFDLARRQGFRRKGEKTSYYNQTTNTLAHDDGGDNNSMDERRVKGGKKWGGNAMHSPRTMYPTSPNPDLHPNLYRVFFRSLDNIRTLEEAQVFISHIKSTYGPLLQYQFARCPETKRYLGYGFMTFRDKAAMDNLLRDGYLRVMQKDFEFQRCGMLDKSVLHHNPSGFSGFYNSAPSTTTTTTSTSSASSAPSTNTVETPALSKEDESSSAPSPSPGGSDLPNAASIEDATGGTSPSSLSSAPSTPTPTPTEAAPPLPKQRVQLWKAAATQKPVEE
ncbi:hypothetical protein BGW41_008022 [Actinomortierella wolfii]|nr:hypothetical protein BGW41_008022 [Actinomortierella wolfii]